MTDLNASLFFKAQFQIAPKGEETDLLWSLIYWIRDWICNKWRRNGDPIDWDAGQWSKWKYGGTILSERGTVILISSYFQEKYRENWACKVVESPDGEQGFAPREWVTEIGFRRPQGEAAEVSIVIFYRDRPGFLGPLAPLPDATARCPRVVQALLNDEKLVCSVGTTRVSMRPMPVSLENWQEFRTLVLSEQRDVPVVYISPKRVQPEGNKTDLLLEPKTLQQITGPNALVCFGTSLDVSRLMSEDDYEKILGCYNGGIRIYAAHPKINEEREGLRHRYLTGDYILQLGSEFIYGMLRRALAQDISIYASCFRVEDCRALSRQAELEKRIACQREEIEESVLNDAIEIAKDMEAQQKALERERDEWAKEASKLEGELTEVKAALHQALARADSFQSDAIQVNQFRQAIGSLRNSKYYPEKPRQIVDFFQNTFSDRLFFTDNAYRSLATCTTSPKTLWNALYDMATILYGLYQSDVYLDIPREFNCKSSFDLIPREGSMTRNDSNLMKNYRDTYNGRTISTEAHIKNGSHESDRNFIRIYFAYDRTTDMLVISSIGKHRDNYSTQNIH